MTLKKILSLVLTFITVITLAVTTIPTLKVEAAERISLDVGKTKYLSATESQGKGTTGWAWTSNNTKCVQIVDGAGNYSCQIKAVAPTSGSPVIVQCRYYYMYRNPYNGTIRITEAAQDFYITVNDNGGTSGGGSGGGSPDIEIESSSFTVKVGEYREFNYSINLKWDHHGWDYTNEDREIARLAYNMNECYAVIFGEKVGSAKYTLMVFNRSNILIKNHNIKIRVVAPKPGDSNNNDSVNLTDVTQIMKKIAGYNISKYKFNEYASDVNADGKINITDVTLILKHIANWDVSLKLR